MLGRRFTYVMASKSKAEQLESGSDKSTQLAQSSPDSHLFLTAAKERGMLFCAQQTGMHRVEVTRNYSF